MSRKNHSCTNSSISCNSTSSSCNSSSGSSSSSRSSSGSSNNSRSSSRKKVLSHPTMGGVILRLDALPEPWESENTSKDLHHS